MSYATKYYKNIENMVFKCLKNKNISKSDKEDILQAVYIRIDKVKWHNETPTELDVCKVAGTISYRQYVRHFNKVIKKHNVKMETKTEDFKQFLDDIKYALNDEENKIMDLLYNHGYNFLEIAKIMKLSDRTIRRRYIVMMNKMKMYKSNISLIHDIVDEEENEDFDLAWNFFKENDLCDNIKEVKVTRKENISLFPNITIKNLIKFIKDNQIDEDTESELWFLYQNNVNTFGFDAKYEKNKEIIDKISHLK